MPTAYTVLIVAVIIPGILATYFWWYGNVEEYRDGPIRKKKRQTKKNIIFETLNPFTNKNKFLSHGRTRKSTGNSQPSTRTSGEEQRDNLPRCRSCGGAYPRGELLESDGLHCGRCYRRRIDRQAQYYHTGYEYRVASSVGTLSSLDYFASQTANREAMKKAYEDQRYAAQLEAMRRSRY